MPRIIVLQFVIIIVVLMCQLAYVSYKYQELLSAGPTVYCPSWEPTLDSPLADKNGEE